ncbi:unnamed protein product [Durusdinium trenchii]|uniref:Alpha-ketoglutarate-dependent dioxygenase AlkB-like domain-containing protein n=1 Tax=Durusdinium trenchii TaxID=1381693 RepID=A0ABP0QHK1_9DINO
MAPVPVPVVPGPPPASPPPQYHPSQASPLVTVILQVLSQKGGPGAAKMLYQEDGDVLIMAGKFQEEFTHAVRQDEATSMGLSAEAPAFNPFVVPHYDFSAEAPAFVPMGRLPKVSEEAATRAPGKLAFGSDTSTEVGDSEDDEKNSPARVKYGLSKQLGARARSGSAGS